MVPICQMISGRNRNTLLRGPEDYHRCNKPAHTDVLARFRTSQSFFNDPSGWYNGLDQPSNDQNGLSRLHTLMTKGAFPACTSWIAPMMKRPNGKRPKCWTDVTLRSGTGNVA